MKRVTQRFFALLMVGVMLTVFTQGSAYAEDTRAVSFDYSDFSQIPIQHEGRIKPLDSFARALLTVLVGKDHLPDASASAWLAEVLLFPERAYERPVFNIANPDVVEAIGLTWRQGHRYSFFEVSQAIEANAALLESIQKLPDIKRSLAQGQLMDVYIRSRVYFDISRSLSLILPQFVVSDEGLSEVLGVSPDVPFTYLEMMQRKDAFLPLVKETLAKSEESLSLAEKEQLRLAFIMQGLSSDENTRTLTLIPPQWEQDGEKWLAPWELLQEGRGSPQTAAYLKQWNALAEAYRVGDGAQWSMLTRDIAASGYAMAGKQANRQLQHLEVIYNSVQPFLWALGCYLLALIAVVMHQIFKSAAVRKLGFILLTAGAIPHFIGIASRIVIMGRPPVATLYESILFVAMIGILYAIIIELRRRDGVGLLIGALLGSVLQFIAMRYAAEGDTMGMLVAVLDTNFWLGTHVVTITIGYGCSLVAGTLAHVYLLQQWRYPDDREKRGTLMSNMLGVGLVAAFFSLFGTILGGIWADQSWGRFWGWDPKENGAMLLVLWLILLLHGRIAKTLSSLTFAVGMALTNIVVALAWFGVNLLNVGLHSYGFTEHIARNLAFFCIAELIFILSLYGMIRINKKQTPR